MGKLSKTHQTTWGIFSLFPLFIYIHILSSGSNEYVVPVGTFIGELDGGGISYLRRFLFPLLPLLCPHHPPPYPLHLNHRHSPWQSPALDAGRWRRQACSLSLIECFQKLFLCPEPTTPKYFRKSWSKSIEDFGWWIRRCLPDRSQKMWLTTTLTQSSQKRKLTR